MSDKQAAAPDSTAVRVALWRAMHARLDGAPHVLEDLAQRHFSGRTDGPRPPNNAEEILVATT